MKEPLFLIAMGLVLSSSEIACYIDSKTAPRSVPLTRSEMKQNLEDLRSRIPRIPLPELTEEDKAKLGERAGSYGARPRYHYLPASDVRGEEGGGAARTTAVGIPRSGSWFGAGRDNDPDMSLSYQFKFQLFWIVSRTNNCQYCLTHRESKLPTAGIKEERIANIHSADVKGDLTPLLKAQVSWIVARQYRAWYATGLAKHRLKELGLNDDQISQLDGDWNGYPPTKPSLCTLARKLAATPVILTDEEVEEAVKLAGPRDVVQLINYTTNLASFNRISEAAGLALQPSLGLLPGHSPACSRMRNASHQFA